MTIRFSRKYKLTIGDPKRKPITAPSAVQASTFVTKDQLAPGMVLNKDENIPRNAVEIIDLHIEATITMMKSDKASASDSTTIEIYNVVEAIANLDLRGYLVVLEAGYSSDVDVPLIFTGSVVNSSTAKVGQDRITKLICNNDTGAKRSSYASFSWPAKTTYDTMITEVLGHLSGSGLASAGIRGRDFSGSDPNVDLFDAIDLALTAVTNTGVAYEGNVIGILDSLCQEVDFRAYIVHNILYVEPKVLPVVAKVITIEPDNIIGDIDVYAEGSKNLSGQVQTGAGIKFEMFLDGRVDPASKIEISFGGFQGTYLVTGVKHKLSYEGKDWLTEVICDGGQIQ